MIQAVDASCLGVDSVAGSGAHRAARAAPNAERRPALGFSVAHPTPGRTSRGPLFQRFMEAVEAANRSDGTEFGRFLAPNADLQLLQAGAIPPERYPFSAEVIRAATGSCMGPYSFDEAGTWAQLSWICRVDAESPLSSFLTFRNSPELSVTVWFENGLIKEIQAMEPLEIPMMRRPAMNAYEALRSARQD